MCIKLNRGARMRTAKRDIKVYKDLYIWFDFNIPNGFTAPFNGVICNDVKCKGVVVFKEDVLYFCTNNQSFRHSDPDLSKETGYKYSIRLYGMPGSNVCVRKTKVGGKPFAEILNNINLMDDNHEIVSIGETYESDLAVEPNGDTIHSSLYSYARRKDAVSDGIDSLCDGLVECVIPKGSKYYVGTTYGYKSYVSDQLRYVNVVC